MADFSFSDDLELQRLNAQVLDEPEEFEHWESLVRAAEAQEGGLNRNSSPQAIAATRDTYDRFLTRFPLFFGYWKKYADLEFSISGTEAAEMVYERGVASISISVDLWTNYCAFKVDTSHDADIIRELFERAADSVGLDFLAHPFWDKYLEFEERLESQDRVFEILTRLINLPLHQYARYFERYRTLAQRRSIAELAADEVILRLREEILRESGGKPKNESDIELELRGRLDLLHLELFQRTQMETTKRWTYESEIKRPYFHVTDLDEAQLSNWRKYLDFEESEGDYVRIKFLYERCLVTAANYDEFWFRYSRWTFGQQDKPKEVRNEALRTIYQRASCIYVPIAQPAIRLQFARFEESLGRSDVAVAIHEAILASFPNHLETIISLINVHRRQSGLDAALAVLTEFLQSTSCTPHNRGALAAERSRIIAQLKNNADAARQAFQEQEQTCLESDIFWTKWLEFEMFQSTLASEQSTSRQRVKAVYDSIRKQARLSAAVSKELTARYLNYLVENGSEDAMVEFMTLDKDVHGPASVSQTPKPRGSVTGGDAELALSSLAERRKGLGVEHAGAQQGIHVVAAPHSVQRSEHGVNGKASP